MRILTAILILVFQSTVAQSGNSATVRTVTGDGILIKSYNFRDIEKYLTTDSDTTYVVNFWATWCGPCVKELPHFEKLNKQYASSKVKVLLVSLDFSKQVSKSLLPFIKKKNLRSEVIHLDDPDANSWVPKVDSTWTGAIPATLIYNRSSRKFYEQSFTYESLEKALKEINQ